MDAPVITHRRRPFLAPIWIPVVLFLIVLAVAADAYRAATTTTVIIVRPGENVLGSIADPPLVPEGERRAEQLARMFGGVSGAGRIAVIYTEPARRTQQMAAPLAGRLGVQPTVLADGDAGDAAARILSETRGRVALVVASVGMIPELIDSLSGIKVAAPREDEYGSIYIVSVPSVGSAGLVRLDY
jgi:broad specificity phosphatase PhoE